MYKRCIIDKNGLEPKSLFNMVQFLMYCKDNKYTVTVEDTLELLYVRLGRSDLTEKITDLFGLTYNIYLFLLKIASFFKKRDQQQKSAIDWQEKEISFSEYLEKITKKAIEERKSRVKEKSKMYNNLIKRIDLNDSSEQK